MCTKQVLLSAITFASLICSAQTFELLPYGNMDNWITRKIHESAVIGGKDKNVYAIGPKSTVTGNKPLPNTGSPWATSNVMAKVAGVTKTSNAVFPDVHGNGHCAKLCSQMETCKALGMVNIKVMVAGSMFLGKMLEPIKSTSDPYSKMEMGIPFTRRPKSLVYDYSLLMPNDNSRIYSSGFSKQKTLPGHDNAEVMVLLQNRWEDANGNIYAKRVATGHELLKNATAGWKDKHHLNIQYGESGKATMGLIPAEKSYYARNSKGEMVPVQEVGWAPADAKPTHLVLMFSAGSGEPYVGTPGLTLYVDNVGFEY